MGSKNIYERCIKFRRHFEWQEERATEMRRRNARCSTTGGNDMCAIFVGTPSDIWRLSIFNPLGTKSKYFLSNARQFPKKNIAFAKVSRIRQFVLVVTSKYEEAYRILEEWFKWETRITERKTFVHATLSTTNPTWTHFELKAASVIRGRRQISWAMARS